MHWLGSETLMSLRVEGLEVNALADSGSQVNTVMPSYLHQLKFPVLPLEDLMDYPLNLIGLGGMRTRPLGFVTLQVQVSEIAGYNEDVIFLVVPDESEFSRHMPLMIGTCTLGRIVNVIKESELDQLSTSWAMVQASHLLCQCGTVALESGDTSSNPADEGATMSEASQDLEIGEPIFMKESMKLGPFQTQIIECKTKSLLGESAHVMVMPLKAGEAQPDGAWPLPPGLHALHAYTWLKMSSSKVSVVGRNMSDSPIYLKKGVQVACMVSASLVPPAELSPEMEAALGAETVHEPMTVTTWQEKLLKKLNLDGLSNWTSRNAATARELILAFHNIFVLDGNEFGCMSAIEHQIHINDSEPFKEWFRCISLLLEEVCTSLRDMLDGGAICPSQSPWCNAVVLVQKKDWKSLLLRRFPETQQAYQKGLIPTASNTGSAGEHGRCHAFLNNGL